jgi:NAD-dependent deacetylase
MFVSLCRNILICFPLAGVRTFRGSSGVWSQYIWTTATRDAFRKDPLQWYNEFWLNCMRLPKDVKPTQAHNALAELLTHFPNLKLITQNVDGLHAPSDQIIEAHGRLGLYKCMPEEDSDTDSDSDDDDDRLVHLGHRRKHRIAPKKNLCRYQQVESVEVDQVEPANARHILRSGEGRLEERPRCPSCRNTMAPQALLFDEGYHSHDFYQFRKMEEWLSEAQVIVFAGTSFNVRLTEIALEHARAESIPVYNFNTQDFLGSTVRLNATNISGSSEETLPRLWQACLELQSKLAMDQSAAEATSTTSRSAGTVRVSS